MKYIIIFSLIFLGGCKCDEPPVPSWSTPKFVTPKRPVLKSDGVGTAGEIARKSGEDVILLEEYAIQLENLLEKIQETPINQNHNNNK